jgi:hypothetical protein
MGVLFVTAATKYGARLYDEQAVHWSDVGKFSFWAKRIVKIKLLLVLYYC